MKILRRKKRWLLYLLCIGFVLHADDHPEQQDSVRMPLEEGRLDVGRMLGRLAEEMGLDKRQIRENVDLSLDLADAADRKYYQRLTELTEGIVTFELDDNHLTINIERAAMRRQSRHIRGEFRDQVEEWFPKAAEAAAARYGIFACTSDDYYVTPADAELGSRVIVLVHGIDDTGRIWNNVIPELLDHGHDVCRFEYPNDQPIADSADSLAKHLAILKECGVRRVSLVAHSMGGLVSREILTRPGLLNGSGDGHMNYPEVEHLIMVGTPNHGAPIARFRGFAEVRDQMVRVFSGDGLLFGGVFDGAGEAKLDLLPESDFLAELNGRPHPQDVDMLVIAGRASPFGSEDVTSFMKHLRAAVPGNCKGCTQFETSMHGLVTGIGDGMVPLASARLEGVDLVVLPANHMTLIRKALPKAPQPPAIPIILERLD
jgi:pimeloyl-ACP methyl ester carboxylesterase